MQGASKRQQTIRTASFRCETSRTVRPNVGLPVRDRRWMPKPAGVIFKGKETICVNLPSPQSTVVGRHVTTR